LVNVNLVAYKKLRRNPRLRLVFELFLISMEPVCLASVNGFTDRIDSSKGGWVQGGPESLLLLSRATGDLLLMNFVHTWPSKILSHQTLWLKSSACRRGLVCDTTSKIIQTPKRLQRGNWSTYKGRQILWESVRGG
jgi:hypothetical protein